MYHVVELMLDAVLNVIPLIVIGAGMHGLPRWLPGGMTFFSVRVPAGFADSAAGRGVMHRFRRRVTILTAIMISVLTGALIWSGHSLPMGATAAAIAVQCIGAFALLAAATRETHGSVAPVPAPAVRSANLSTTAADKRSTFQALAYFGIALPVAMILFAAAFVAHTHVASDRPVLWLVAAFAGAVGMATQPITTQLALRYWARSSDWNRDPVASARFRAVLGLQHALVCAGGVVGWVVILTIGNDVKPAVFALWAPALALGTLATNSWLRRHVSTGQGDPMPDDRWTWGLFYYNPDDPALVVPHRYGISLSLNHARLATWLFAHLPALLALLGVLATVAPRTNDRANHDHPNQSRARVDQEERHGTVLKPVVRGQLRGDEG